MKLTRVKWKDEIVFDDFGNQPFLIYTDEVDEEFDVVPLGTPTSHELADLCSRGAEEGNYHGLISAYPKLRSVLEDRLGEEMTAKIMMDIAELGGIENMG